jgi:hypothetical protein
MLAIILIILVASFLLVVFASGFTLGMDYERDKAIKAINDYHERRKGQ